MNRLFSLAFIITLISIVISCQKEISLEENSPANAAKGSLKDTLGNCLPINVHGTFYNGIKPSGDTNFVSVQVQVDSIGAYNIFTNTGNGIYFGDSGVFSSTGLQTIKLKPHGTPQQTGNSDYIINFDTTACGFTVLVKDSTGTDLSNHQPSDTTTTTPGGGGTTTPLPTGNWEFFDSTHGVKYSGNTLGGSFVGLLQTLSLVEVSGSPFFVFGIGYPSGTTVVKTGSYSTAKDGFTSFYFVSTTLDIESSLSTLRGDSEIIINITSYNASTKVVEGSFSGSARDKSGNLIYITKGKFKTSVIYA